MKVVLPDQSELELPDGATGLDAARAIGPKLAEQAVLVRSNGRELDEGRQWTREEVSAEEARERFEAENEPYKVELVGTAEGPISFYTQGDFTDLCRGPHLQDSRPIKAIKLTGLAGAYWRGDEKNTQLTRIYGTAFYSQADLDAYLERIEEAKRRDHRRLGPQFDLFHFSEHSPGSALWHPKGMVLFNTMEEIRRRENAKRGYHEVRTPIIYDAETFITSGHFPKYENLMYKLEVDEHPWAMKAMNCPGHMLLFGSKLRSYRELPVRYAEPTPLHRNELTGTLHGLLRVRMITQDDAHIFCTEEQIQDEIAGVVAYARYLYELFGMTASAELSTRPDNKLGTDEQWDKTEAALEEALKLNEIPYELAPGEGAFYGPKIDLHMEDALGRRWQMGTIQLDSQMPSRFGLTYVGPDNREHPLYVVHRALYGSFERFIGILIEHYAGAFPVWLAPVQLRLIPVGADHRQAVHALKEKLESLRVDIDERDETVGKRIRDAEVEKVPYVVVYGDKESDDSLAVRKRGGEQITLSLDALRAEISEVATL